MISVMFNLKQSIWFAIYWPKSVIALNVSIFYVQSNHVNQVGAMLKLNPKIILPNDFDNRYF